MNAREEQLHERLKALEIRYYQALERERLAKLELEKSVMTGSASSDMQGSQLAGIQNCVANFGGVASPIVAGAILSATNSFQIALYTYGITAVIGALIYGCYLGKIEQIKVPEK